MSSPSPFQWALAAIRTALFTLAFFCVSSVITVLALLFSPLGPAAVGGMATLWAYSHRILSHVILGQRIVIEGVIPPDVRFFVGKHEAMFETIDALCLFDRPAIAAKRELLTIPLWGWVARLYGIIPVDREGGARTLRAVRSQAQAVMATGRVFILYPEGTRVRRGESPPLKPGFAGLYAVMNMPVVPIAIDSGRLNPRGRQLRFPGTITYRFGEPIPPGLPRAEAEARVHAAINALNEGAQS